MKDLSRERIAEIRANVDNEEYWCGSTQGPLCVRLTLGDAKALLDMASRALAADEELAGRRAYYASCMSVGISAHWCPECGDCTCPLGGDLDTPDCPLHGTKSLHCAPPIEDAASLARSAGEGKDG